MNRFNLLLKKLIDNKYHLFNFLSFFLGIFLSKKNKSEFGVEFNKCYSKLMLLDKNLNEFIKKFK